MVPKTHWEGVGTKVGGQQAKTSSLRCNLAKEIWSKNNQTRRAKKKKKKKIWNLPQKQWNNKQRHSRSIHREHVEFMQQQKIGTFYNQANTFWYICASDKVCLIEPLYTVVQCIVDHLGMCGFQGGHSFLLKRLATPLSFGHMPSNIAGKDNTSYILCHLSFSSLKWKSEEEKKNPPFLISVGYLLLGF